MLVAYVIILIVTELLKNTATFPLNEHIIVGNHLLSLVSVRRNMTS